MFLLKKDVMRLGARSTFTDSLCWQLAGRLEGTGKEKKKEEMKLWESMMDAELLSKLECYFSSSIETQNLKILEC